MFPISKQYLQSPCEIKTLSNELLTTGVLSDILHGSLQISNSFDILPVIHCNTPVKINVYNHSLGFRVLIGKVFLSTPEMMQITNIQNLTDFERRGFFRIKVNIKTKAILLKENDDSPEKKEPQPLNIDVTDLSLSGLFLTAREHLEIGQFLLVTLTLYEIDIPFRCRIERKKPIDHIHTGYGCSFPDNSTRQFDLLCKYIFEKQREQIKITRETQSQ